MTQPGFGQRAGAGVSPALVVIDLAYGFTDPTSPLGCDLSSVLEATGRLLEQARAHGVPVFFTTVEYDDVGLREAAVFIAKIPALRVLTQGSRLCEIDAAVAPAAGEPVLRKYHASGFHGTDLEERLRALGVDTVILAGATTSGCVRATAVDALQRNLRVLVVEEAVGDRDLRAHAASLYDIDAKYGDVTSLEQALAVIGGRAAAPSSRSAG